MILQVALPTPVDDYFDYLPLDGGNILPPAGSRVQVEFGTRLMLGVVVGHSAQSRLDPQRLKPVVAVLDDAPVLPDDMLELLHRAARYYHHPLGEVIATALPKLLRENRPLDNDSLQCWRASTGAPAESITSLKRSKQRRQILTLLQRHPTGLGVSALRATGSGWRKHLAALQADGLVSSSLDAPAFVPPANAAKPALNAQQQAAVDHLAARHDFHVCLLEGVTGSGKTEVFLNLMEPLLQAGKQVLILVPEIGLTPQLQDRFQQRFGDAVCSLHSGLAQRERLQAWQRAAAGHDRIVLGTRSALFTPMPQLGLIIVDEEHDVSFKQQEGFRYHARDLAILRARINQVPVLLASATPSLESLAKAHAGQYSHLRLTQRAGDATPPLFQVLDLRQQFVDQGLTRPLLQQMTEHLGAGNQVMLFMNRRGFAPVMLCHDCGKTVGCPHCDANITFHAGSHSVRCHHCGYISRPPAKCADCGGTNLVHLGVGTEKLEQAVKQRFPDFSSIRIDRDTMARKGELQHALDAIRSRQHQIIIGTQMLAKGHDFPNITLVGIIDVDQGLFSTELRALERLGQQILQVGGRAGRGQLQGRVVLQTHQPDHPALQSLLQGGYNQFAALLLGERKLSAFPPYGYLALLRASALKSADAAEFLQVSAQLADSLRSADTLVLGPIAASMEKRAGRYHHQLLLSTPSRKHLHTLLQRLLPQLRQLKQARKVRWSIDVDPMESV